MTTNKQKSEPAKKADTGKAYTAADIAKDTGAASPGVVRRILRAAGLKRPKDGWTWPDKGAAKDALAAVQRAQKREAEKPA